MIQTHQSPSTDGSKRLIEFEEVTKTFPSTRKRPPFTAVRSINLTMHEGEFLCIVGPSGCGKSTLPNMVAGLMAPSNGCVRYDGSEVGGINRRVGYMTQADNLLPWKTVGRNVALGLELRGVSKVQRSDRVGRVLQMVGLEDFAHRYPSQLSGGMRKRTALARTLIYEPETLLMDEPFGALDAQMRLILQQELLDICERAESTVIFITHDIEEAILLGDRVAVMGSAPGRITHVEPVDYPRPRNIGQLRTEPGFKEKWNRIWALIEATITQSR